MGRRGPPKKPTELKLLQGTPGGKHKLPKNEPKPRKAASSVRPAFLLSKEARKIWNKSSKIVRSMGVLTEADTGTFTRYNDLFEKFLRVRQFLIDNGDTYETVNERSKSVIIRPRPELAEFHRLETKLTKLEMQFGLTPASRASLNLAPKKKSGEEDPREKVRKELYG